MRTEKICESRQPKIWTANALKISGFDSVYFYSLESYVINGWLPFDMRRYTLYVNTTMISSPLLTVSNTLTLSFLLVRQFRFFFCVRTRSRHSIWERQFWLVRIKLRFFLLLLLFCYDKYHNFIRKYDCKV